MLIYFVWVYLALAAITAVASVGAERKPLTPRTAAVTLVVLLLMGIGAYLVR